MLVNIAEAKAQLSQIIERVHRGEKITIAKNNLPLVDLIPHQPQKPRQLGIAQGLITFSDDVFASDNAEIEQFYTSELEP